MLHIIISFILLVLSASVSYGQRYHSGYYRSGRNPGYVRPYVQSTPNRTNWDNYSTRGNRNPYTGQSGSRARDYSTGAYNYGNDHAINRGSNGGQYYYNNRSNKVYVPKRW